MHRHHDISPVFVTGGAGFIGSNFVRRWIAERKTPVVVLDKLTYAGNLQSLEDVADSPLYTFAQGDICDTWLVNDLLRSHGCGSIINFAAETHVDRSIDAPAPFVQTNIVGTCNLLEAARRYHLGLSEHGQESFRFLHISTDEVYGVADSPEGFREDSPCRPNSPYAASKAAADHLVRAYHKTYGLPTLVTRCTNNYGPWQFPEKLIPLMVRNAIEGKELPIYGDGLHRRDWIHVDDHCRAIRAVLETGTPGEVYNIGASGPRRNLDVVRAICSILDDILTPIAPETSRESLIRFVADRAGHDRCYCINDDKIRSRLGWRPKVKFPRGLCATVEWYLENMDVYP